MYLSNLYDDFGSILQQLLYPICDSMQEQKPTGFNIDYTIRCLQVVCKQIGQTSQVPFEQFCEVLNQFCFVFKQLNSFLGIAFSDVKQKVGHINTNCAKFPGHAGFISFIKMQIEKGVHVINGKDNAKKKVPAQFATYSSTARNLLRMMWLLTFIKVTFQRCKDFPTESLSSIFTFGNNHAWLLRKSAKVAMMASQNKQKFIEVILKGQTDQKKFQQYNIKFLEVLLPVHDFLWKFYKDNKIQKLQ